MSEQKINVTTIDNVRWHLRETKVVEGIREYRGGQGGSSCNKINVKIFLKKSLEHRLEGGEVGSHVWRTCKCRWTSKCKDPEAEAVFEGGFSFIPVRFFCIFF